MASMLDLEVVTPEKAVFHEPVDDVVVPGMEGQMDLLPGHLPLLAALDVGEMIIRQGDTERHFLIDQGYAEVVDDNVVILTEACEGVEDIDIEQARRLLKQTREELSELEEVSKSEEVEEELFDRHRTALKRQRMRLAFAEEGDGEE